MVFRRKSRLDGEGELADFLQETPELRRRREAHGSIRIQEGEPPSFAADLHHSIVVSINGESFRRSSSLLWAADSVLRSM
jgi:hypothetical protein